MKLIALTDSLAPWHSFWIRFGQYINNLPAKISIINDNSNLTDLTFGDWLFIYRYDNEWSMLDEQIKKLKKIGVNIIADIDDYLWDAPQGWDRKRLKGLTNMLSGCHTITCSTKALEDILTIMFPKQKIILIRNSTPRLTKTENGKDNIPTICWTGAPWTRIEDLAIIQPLAKWIQFQNIEVKWKHIGNMDGRITFAEVVGIDVQKVETVELCGYQEYIKQLKGDIGLAPTKKCNFNSFKSELKILEYSGANMAWIASDSSAYRSCAERLILPERLCSTPYDWIENLQKLLDPDLRKTEAAYLYEQANKLQGYDYAIKKWTQLLTRGIYREQ